MLIENMKFEFGMKFYSYTGDLFEEMRSHSLAIGHNIRSEV